MAPQKIFISWPGYAADDAETGGLLRRAGYELLLRPKLGARSEDELIGLMEDAVAALVSTDPFTARVIDANPSLRVIARVGVGTDSIDHAAALRRRVGISVTPGMNAQTVADHALALILALVRRIVVQDASVKAGRWERVGAHAPTELPGKVVGLVGAGGIGRAVAKRLSGFDASVVFFDKNVESLDNARRVATLGELLAVSDIVSLHVPLLDETHHLIDAAALRAMKPSAILVNTARGPVVDTAALFAALREGRLAGAGLDVFEDEPPPAALIRDVPNLICTAHLAGLSHESIRRMTISATESILAVLAGGIPDTVVNPEALRLRAGERAA